MSSQLIEKHRDGAEVYHDDPALCKQKLHELLADIRMPASLFPPEVVEFGYNRASGFMWIKYEKKEQYTFKKFKKTVSYDAKVTAFVEKGRMRNVTGFKDKEMFLWIPISEILTEDAPSGKITFRLASGLSGSCPISDLENLYES